MVESHFQIQLTAILDGLMKTAVSDICALTDSWVQSLQMEIRRSQRENRDLKQKLYSMEQPPPAQTPPEEKSEVEEAPVNTDLTSATSNDVVPTPVCEDSKGNPPLYELKTELERTGPGLQNPECSPDVTADFENEHEDPALLDQNNETESTEHFPQPKTEEEDEFDVSCLLMPDLQPSSTQLHRDSHSQSTNPDSNCMSLNFENNFNLSATVPVARRFAKRTSVSLTCEKQIRESFICNICGKTLTAKRSFICHLRLHTGERPFKCIQCGKSFAKKFNLDVHYNVHSGARPYACPLCPRSFADPSAFGRHKMVHRKKLLQDTYSPKSTFVCNICGQSFSSRPSLTLHFRLHAAEKQHSAQKVLYRNVH
ncbi:zinc finger protein 324B isoform X2 [Astyanax mexicanus]|uniref:zinc finger protein 324B isoform X2 n=1 Tax=Astyanax mexicanus TaxID=7994 RepID=UPI0020CAB0C4|nr:zinc finger protein 324B isoform X2 [Astyanax mexicanus]